MESIKSTFLIFFLSLQVMLSPQAIYAQGDLKAACHSELKEIFKGIPDRQIYDYVGAQTALTMHRLAWAHMTYLKSQGKKTFGSGDVAEKSILGLIKPIEESIKDQAGALSNTEYYQEAKKAFEAKANANSASTSRDALNALAPYMRQAVHEQLKNDKNMTKEQRSLYAINASDMLMISLLREGMEKSDNPHTNLWRDYGSQNKNMSKSQYYDKMANGKLKATNRVNLLTMMNSSYLVTYQNDKNNIKQDVDQQINKLQDVVSVMSDNVNKQLEEMIDPSKLQSCLNAYTSGECKPQNFKDLAVNFSDIAGLLEEYIEERSKDDNFQQALLERLRLCNQHTKVYGICPPEDKQANCGGAKCRCNPNPNPNPKKDEICKTDGLVPSPSDPKQCVCPNDPSRIASTPLDCDGGKTDITCSPGLVKIEDKCYCPNSSIIAESTQQCSNSTGNTTININNNTTININNNTTINTNNTTIVLQDGSVHVVPIYPQPQPQPQPGKNLYIIPVGSAYVYYYGTQSDANAFHQGLSVGNQIALQQGQGGAGGYGGGTVTPIIWSGPYPPGNYPGGPNYDPNNPGGFPGPITDGNIDEDIINNDKEDKIASGKWTILLNQKVNAMIERKGDLITGIVTQGKEKYDTVYVCWTAKPNDPELAHYKFDSQLPIAQFKNFTASTADIYGIYLDEAYILTATLSTQANCIDKDKILDTDSITIKAEPSFSFSCKSLYNQAQPYCQKAQRNYIRRGNVIYRGMDYEFGKRTI